MGKCKIRLISEDENGKKTSMDFDNFYLIAREGDSVTEVFGKNVANNSLLIQGEISLRVRNNAEMINRINSLASVQAAKPAPHMEADIVSHNSKLNKIVKGDN